MRANILRYERVRLMPKIVEMSDGDVDENFDSSGQEDTHFIITSPKSS